jgi:hypothetical protein
LHAKRLREKEEREEQKRRLIRIQTIITRRVQLARQESQQKLETFAEEHGEMSKAKQRWVWAIKKVIHENRKVISQRLVRRVSTSLVVKRREQLAKEENAKVYSYEKFYEGAKLFWRSLETIDVNMFMHNDPETLAQTPENCTIIEVVGFHVLRQMELSRIYVLFEMIAAPLRPHVHKVIVEQRKKEVDKNGRFGRDMSDEELEEMMAERFRVLLNEEVAQRIYARLQIDNHDRLLLAHSSAGSEEQNQAIIDEYRIVDFFTPAVVERTPFVDISGDNVSVMKKRIGLETASIGARTELASSYSETASVAIEKLETMTAEEGQYLKTGDMTPGTLDALKEVYSNNALLQASPVPKGMSVSASTSVLPTVKEPENGSGRQSMTVSASAPVLPRDNSSFAMEKDDKIVKKRLSSRETISERRNSDGIVKEKSSKLLERRRSKDSMQTELPPVNASTPNAEPTPNQSPVPRTSGIEFVSLAESAEAIEEVANNRHINDDILSPRGIAEGSVNALPSINGTEA